MKDLALGGAVLALLLGLCFSASMGSARRVEALLQPLSAAQTALSRGDLEEAEPYLREAEQEWEDARRYFSGVHGEESLEEVSRGFRRLAAFCAAREEAETCAAHAELCAMLEYVRSLDLLQRGSLL